MANTSIKNRTAACAVTSDAQELRYLLDAALVDNTALRATVAALVIDVTALDAAMDTLIAKLNADTGITDVNYAGAAAMTATAPDALTLES